MPLTLREFVLRQLCRKAADALHRAYGPDDELARRVDAAGWGYNSPEKAAEIAASHVPPWVVEEDAENGRWYVVPSR